MKVTIIIYYENLVLYGIVTILNLLDHVALTPKEMNHLSHLSHLVTKDPPIKDYFSGAHINNLARFLTVERIYSS